LLRSWLVDALFWVRPARGVDVMHDRPNTDETPGSAQVLRFELRRRTRPQPPALHAIAGGDAEPLDDLAQYEDEDAHIDYRHRMLMNVIALAVVTVLVGAGVWIADTIADMEKAQDCAMQGRQNCAPIEVALPKQ
jgi:hypothetical protein